MLGVLRRTLTEILPSPEPIVRCPRCVFVMRYHGCALITARKDEHHHMQELRDRLLSLRDRIAHVLVRL